MLSLFVATDLGQALAARQRPESVPMKPTPLAVPFVALLISVPLLFTGCVSSRYRMAKKDTPPPKMLNVAFAPAPLGAVLDTLITYDGPGSWKRDAFWDEYVVTLNNPGSRPLTVSGVALVDFVGTDVPPGSNPWALEKRSKTLEQQYKDAGLTFVRTTAPGALIVGAGVAGVASAGVFSAAAGAAATATVIALPVYYIAVIAINHHNKAAVEKEFDRRRLVLPLTLAAGESRSVSLFFPMIPEPRRLDLVLQSEGTTSTSSLPLDFLKGLHLGPPKR